MAMKVIVYSNFPEALVAKDVTPKLEKFGVEVLSVINVDKGKVTDFGEADALCAMVEKMSAGQRDKVKATAKAAGKPYYPLTRASSDWVKFFGNPGPAVIYEQPRRVLIPPPPPSSSRVVLPASAIEEAAPPSKPVPAAPPSYNSATAIELLTQKITTLEGQLRSTAEVSQSMSRRNRSLEEELQAQRAAVEKTRNERDQMTQRCQQLNKTIEERNVELQKLINAVPILPPAVDEEDFMRILSERDAFKRSYDIELKAKEALEALRSKQAEELYRLREEVKKLKTAAPAPPPSNGVDTRIAKEFFKVREAFKLLWESKAMKADDVLKQLFDWKAEG